MRDWRAHGKMEKDSGDRVIHTGKFKIIFVLILLKEEIICPFLLPRSSIFKLLHFNLISRLLSVLKLS